MFGNKCRYYPTCSVYALWEFENENFFKAFYKSVLRILRCNQLFKGGIDYPVIKKDLKNVTYGKKIKVKYWLVPKEGKKFYLIKVENG